MLLGLSVGIVSLQLTLEHQSMGNEMACAIEQPQPVHFSMRTAYISLMFPFGISAVLKNMFARETFHTLKVEFHDTTKPEVEKCLLKIIPHKKGWLDLDVTYNIQFTVLHNLSQYLPVPRMQNDMIPCKPF